MDHRIDLKSIEAKQFIVSSKAKSVVVALALCMKQLV